MYEIEVNQSGSTSTRQISSPGREILDAQIVERLYESPTENRCGELGSLVKYYHYHYIRGEICKGPGFRLSPSVSCFSFFRKPIEIASYDSFRVKKRACIITIFIYLGSFGGRFLPKILKRIHLQQGEMYHSFIPVTRTAQHELAVFVESGCG